jgi:hypothetical protein
MGFIRFALLVAMFGFVAGSIFLGARNRARRSSSARRLIMLGGAVAVAGASFLWIELPSHVPDTQGSPAGLLFVVLAWFVSGALILLGGFSFLGAAFARVEPPGQ